MTQKISIRRVIKKILRVRLVYTLIICSLKKCKIEVHRGGTTNFLSGSEIDGNGQLIFNASHYRNGFYRKGNIALFRNAKLNLNSGKVTVYSGCKIDVFENAELSIGSNVFINESTRIGTKSKIVIGNDTIIGDETSIHDFDGHKINGIEGIRPIIIGEHVWIGEKVVILKGVNIGDNAIIGAGSVVTKNIPSNTIVAGNPAHIIRSIEEWSIG